MSTLDTLIALSRDPSASENERSLALKAISVLQKKETHHIDVSGDNDEAGVSYIARQLKCMVIKSPEKQGDLTVIGDKRAVEIAFRVIEGIPDYGMSGAFQLVQSIVSKEKFNDKRDMIEVDGSAVTRRVRYRKTNTNTLTDEQVENIANWILSEGE